MEYQERLPSFAHQTEARSRSKDRDYFGYLMEQGTGKSKTLIDDACQQYLAGKITTLIITAPNGVQRAWATQHFPDHMPVGLPYRMVVFVSKPNKKQAMALDQLLDPAYTGLRVFILNYESLRGKGKGAYDSVQFFLKTFRCMWVLDESHRIKTWESKSTGAIINLSDKAVMRRVMTGTPSTQGPMDLFPQMMFLDQSVLGFSSYTAYRNHFAEMEPHDSNTMWMIKRRLEQKYGKEVARKRMPQLIARDENGRQRFKNLDELQRLISAHTYRKLKTECLDLPPKVYQKRFVTLTAEQRNIYDTIVDKYMAEYNGQFLDASMALTRLTRLQQITGGFFPLEDGTVVPIGETNPKLDELVETIEDTEGKIIIWARYTAELEMIVATLKQIYDEPVARYWGAVKPKDKDAGKAAFCDKNHPCRFFVAQQQSGGTGLDGLQIASTEIYFSNDFSLLNRLQSEDRGHRMGMAGSLTIIDLEAVDTRDSFIIDALRNKKDVADLIVGDPSKAWI